MWGLFKKLFVVVTDTADTEIYQEKTTIVAMDTFAKQEGYVLDMGSPRCHHEIYLSDLRRCKPERLKTVIHHPVRKTDDR